MDKNQQDIVLLKETNLFYKYAIPNILSFILISSSGIVDTLFIGKFAGEHSLAAINISQPIFSFIWGIAIMIMTGSAVTTGKYLGEKNIEKACVIFTKSIFAVACISIITILIVYFFIDKIIYKIGGSDNTSPLAIKYIYIILLFVIFNTIGYGLSIFARVDGFPFIASFSIIAGAITNILLDALFIAYYNMGVAGAGYATGISFVIQFFILAIHFSRKKGSLRIIFDFKEWSDILKSSFNGLSEFVNEISIGITMALYNSVMLKYAGDSGVVAFTAIIYVLWFGNMINYAVSDTLNPLISINYGAAYFNRIKNFLKTSIVFVISNGIFLFLIITFLGTYLISLFIVDNTSPSYFIAVEFINIVKLVFFISGVNMILSSYFTAMLRPKESAFIAVMRSLIMPCSLIIILPVYFGNLGIYSALPLSEAITFVVAIALFLLTKNVLLKR